VTPDGRRAVSGSLDHTLKVWDLESGEALCTLEGHRDEINVVVVTPDGCWIVSGSEDKTLRVWDLQSGVEMALLTVHGSIKACAVASDGSTLVAGDKAGQVHFLHMENLPLGPLIITAIDSGTGPTLRCPLCQHTFPLQIDWLGSIINCPKPDCDTQLKINPFITRMA
jgi:WD40 repeat protein